MEQVKNATTPPKIYYGLHMVPGVAEYHEPDSEPYRIFVGESTIKNMDQTFQGKPVYVQHVDEVNLANLQAEADGYVVESFFNQRDGKHWAKFIVVSDRGHEAIRSGWKLSNAYVPKTFSGGGLWNGVEFLKEVTSGEYEHLALVPNPRYAESIILTPEEFKAYNEEKELELKKVANSNNKGETSMFEFLKKEKVTNSKELEAMCVVLPKSKREVVVGQVLNEMDDMYKKDEGKDPKAPAMANGEHHVMVGEEKMAVNDLIEKHMALKEEHNAMKSELEDLKKKKESALDEGDDESMDNEEGLDMGEEKAEKDKKASDKTENEEGLDMGEEKAEKDKKASDKTENKKKNELDAKKVEALKKAEALKNAPFTVIRDPVKVDLDKAARGRARYGSSN